MKKEMKTIMRQRMNTRDKQIQVGQAEAAVKAEERKTKRKEKYGYDYPPLIIDVKRMVSNPNKVMVRMKSRSIEDQPDYKQCPGVLELTLRDWEHFASKINWDFGEVPDIDKR